MNKQTKPVKADVATQNIWLGKMGFDFDAKNGDWTKVQVLSDMLPKKKTAEDVVGNKRVSMRVRCVDPEKSNWAIRVMVEVSDGKDIDDENNSTYICSLHEYLYEGGRIDTILRIALAHLIRDSSSCTELCKLTDLECTMIPMTEEEEAAMRANALEARTAGRNIRPLVNASTKNIRRKQTAKARARNKK